MVEGVGKIIKYSLFVANLIIFIGGIAVFAVGVWVSTDKAFIDRLVGSNLYMSSASILIATGVIVTVISFLGCMGAVKEIKCMLLTFFIILFMIFITMLVGGILAYVFKNEVSDALRREMLLTVPLYGNETAVTDSWDAAQENFKCCGYDEDGQQGYKIWTRNSRFTGNIKVPKSCCKSQEKTEVTKCQETPNEENAYLDGCYDKAKEFLQDHAVIVGGIGIGIACVLIIGMVLSCSLFMLID